MAARLLQNLGSVGGPGLAALIGLGGIGYGVSESLYTIEGGHRGVMFSRIHGVLPDIFEEGLHFRIPWFEYPIIYDVRARPHWIASLTGSKDLQMVNIKMRILAKPNTDKLPEIYRTLGEDYDTRVLPSIGNEVLKSVVAQYNASQLITKREEISNQIRVDLMDRAKDFYIKLDDVSITDLSFGQEYTAAVEAKQVAQQNAQRAALIVEQAKMQKQQKVVEALGEAKSAELIGNAMKNNPGFLHLRRIEAAREIAHTMAHSSNRVYLDSDNLLLAITNIADITQSDSHKSKR